MNKISSLSIKLKPLFKKLPIDIVYLYGSRSDSKNDQLSDYDFGILFSEGLSDRRRFDLRLRLFGDIAKVINNVYEDNIDVVDLDEVPVLLQFNIISGKVIYCKDKERRIIFETYVMARYNDEHYYYDRYLLETLEKVKKGIYFDRQIPYS